jgi:hypothetical protein
LITSQIADAIAEAREQLVREEQERRALTEPAGEPGSERAERARGERAPSRPKRKIRARLPVEPEEEVEAEVEGEEEE